MFIQPKPTGMSFTALMSSARLSPKEQTPFPYTPDVVRCRYHSVRRCLIGLLSAASAGCAGHPSFTFRE